MSGYQAGDVRAMMGDIFGDAQEDRSTMSELTKSVIAASGQAQSKLTDVLKATKAPQQTALETVSPVAVVLVVLFVLWKIL